MALRIAVPKETAEGENRIAATPDTVRKLAAQGLSVSVAPGAGEGSALPDALFSQAGAAIGADGEADIVVRVQVDTLEGVKNGAVVVGLVNPHKNDALIAEAAQKNITLLAMELVPRITRAQAMDVLSSQSNLAGYKSVLVATEHYARAFPMMMTAAGTIAAAKVFVMGAGVAGLQAIATARRLGAVVSATDVRPAAKEQVKSLGAAFVAVEDEEFKAAETAGGYAKEMSADYKEKQAKLIEETIAKQDVVITTALIPGRPAPKLVSEEMVISMKPGSVIVDLAAENGGNCALTKPGEIVQAHGVTIVGHKNLANLVATDASSLYARNVLNLLNLIVKDGALAIDWDDDIIKGMALTRGGKRIHPQFGGAPAQAV